MKGTLSQNFKDPKFLSEREVLITNNTNKICYWTEDSHGCTWSQAWLEFLTLYIFVSYKTYTVSQTRSASIFTWNRENRESSLVVLLERASVNPVAVKILHVILYCVEDFGLYVAVTTAAVGQILYVLFVADCGHSYYYGSCSNCVLCRQRCP